MRNPIVYRPPRVVGWGYDPPLRRPPPPIIFILYVFVLRFRTPGNLKLRNLFFSSLPTLHYYFLLSFSPVCININLYYLIETVDCSVRKLANSIPRTNDNLKNPFRIASILSQNAHFVTLGPIYEKLVVMFLRCYTFVCSVMRSYCPDNLVTLGST